MRPTCVFLCVPAPCSAGPLFPCMSPNALRRRHGEIGNFYPLLLHRSGRISLGRTLICAVMGRLPIGAGPEGKPVRIAPPRSFDVKTERRKVSASRARQKDAESNAVKTRLNHPNVHTYRCGSTKVLQKISDALSRATAFWKRRRMTLTPAEANLGGPRPDHQVNPRYVDHQGKLKSAKCLELRDTAKHQTFVAVHCPKAREQDRRCSSYICVPLCRFVDELPPSKPSVPFRQRNLL